MYGRSKRKLANVASATSSCPFEGGGNDVIDKDCFIDPQFDEVLAAAAGPAVFVGVAEEVHCVGVLFIIGGFMVIWRFVIIYVSIPIPTAVIALCVIKCCFVSSVGVLMTII